MITYVVSIKVEQALDPIICLKTKKNIVPELSLKVTFQLNHEHDDDIEWHNNPRVKIIFIEMVNLDTQKIIDYEDLPIIAQINTQRQCREYLRFNNLDPYQNIFPFNAVPYRYSDMSNQDYSRIAEIINFSNNLE